MVNEIGELLDVAIDREIVSEAFYIAARDHTQDPGARELLGELVAQEARHREWVKELKYQGVDLPELPDKKVPDLKIGEDLIDINLAENAGLQDVITAAIRREKNSIEFYQRLEQLMVEGPASQLCRKLAQEEGLHKYRLEIFYDDFFLKEN